MSRFFSWPVEAPTADRPAVSPLVEYLRELTKFPVERDVKPENIIELGEPDFDSPIPYDVRQTDIARAEARLELSRRPPRERG